MAVKDGWRGRFFEDFEVGDVYRHPLGRTVTETDNVWFTLLIQNTALVHFDRHYAAQTEFGRLLVDVHGGADNRPERHRRLPERDGEPGLARGSPTTKPRSRPRSGTA